MPLVEGAHGDDLLREDVERVARVARLLDQAGEHALRDDGGLEQVAAVLREDLAAAGLAHLVAGAADPLQAARDRARRLDLHDEVDRAHVDAELQRRGRDDAPERAGLQPVLDLLPLLARERAVVRAHEVLLGELVQPRGQALGEAPRVREHDGRAVRADQLEQLRVDRGPDRRALLRAGGRAAPRLVEGPAHLRHVLDGDDHLDLHALAVTGVDDRDGAWRTRSFVPAEEARDLLERALRGRQTDPLRRRVGEAFEPFEREREVRAPLRGRQRVDLVDDHPPDAAERLARLRGEQEVEGLRRGDEDVGRAAQHLPALGGRGVAGAHADRGPVAPARGRAARPRARCRPAGRAGSSRRRRRGRASARRTGAGCDAPAAAAGSAVSRSSP